MLIDTETARYLVAVGTALEANHLTTADLTVVCPECNEVLETRFADGSHIVMDTPHIMDEDAGYESFALVVGCEGYWLIDPAKVGLPRGNWMTPEECQGVTDNPPVDMPTLADNEWTG